MTRPKKQGAASQLSHKPAWRGLYPGQVAAWLIAAGLAHPARGEVQRHNASKLLLVQLSA
ncbi:hypothetical protein A4R35_08750 [Thermogemmatispora tikiterensis]|uniref:Uncharacterized protein n=1 Tax=Thermogemmatispora tikiterensis TaxID=1825093 RepID=A0A328VIL1_9CHLR|nr:hypothetical protein A4R35_08750 [Thermogemmatispora tikiterensis]